MSRQFLQGRDKSGYLSEATIAALATAPGGAVSILRISGPGSFESASSLAGEQKIQDLPPRKLARVKLQTSDGGEPRWIDDAMWVRFVAPESFTGEDVVELHLHGSSFIADQVMEELAKSGVRQALPGEFSFRAVRNGKISLSQAQAIADLISASNEGATQLALEKLSGTQTRLITSLADRLRRLAVMSEVGIDFADQDVEEVSLPSLKKQLAPLELELVRLRESYARGSRVQDGIRVAFIGLPNAGKSSFFNALLGEERSIVSEIAGTTRDVVRERLTLRGRSSSITLRLEDTAGLRHSEDRVEVMGITRTAKAARDADLVLFLLDPASDLVLALEQWNKLGAPASKALGIMTKCDLAKPLSPAELTAFGIERWLATSSMTGVGVDQTTEAMIDFCTIWTQRERQEVLLTRVDHLSAVNEALAHLDRAQKSAEMDLFSADLRHTLHSLSPLIGETLPDDILGKIFSDFCIGK